MGTVTALSVWRAAREAADRAERARIDHPSLRWVAGSMWWLAHRRNGRQASCGVGGELVLAPPGVPLCPTCYPQVTTGDV